MRNRHYSRDRTSDFQNEANGAATWYLNMATEEKKTKRSYKVCCVPLCNNDTRYSGVENFSFHQFPSQEALRKRWIVNIRRDVGPYFQVSIQYMLN
jgi:hypothetical protein